MSLQSRPLPLVLFTLLWVTGVAGCSEQASSGGGPGAASPGGANQPPNVGVVTIEPQRTRLTAELPGRTLPYAVSDVRPQVNGILEKRLFVEGGTVAAGDVLYEIDDTLYRAAHASARAQLASAEAAQTTARLRADRYKSLLADSSISQQEYDDAQATLQQAEAAVAERSAEVEIARINLGYTKIKAPIPGKIGRSYLTQGALVTANQDQTLATIQTLDPIYVDMNQSAGELESLRRSGAARRGSDADTSRVTLTFDDGTPYTEAGVLRFSETLVEASTGTVTLRAEFPNPDGVLLPGMFVRATVVERIADDALLVPQRGVGRDERGNPTALVVREDGIAEMRNLSVGQTVGSNWLVTEGIAPGDRVIVEGLQYARSGQPVNAVPFEPPTTDGS